MFVGHYGPAFAAKATVQSVPLWVLFVAVQWLDICWSTLVLMGVEKLRIVPGFTEGSPLDLYYMPFSHGLIGALALSILLGAAVALVIRKRWVRVFLVVAAAAFSHWLLDLLVHVPDLPLWGDRAKVGLGLWRYMWPSFGLELVALVAGAVIYARRPGATRAQIPWLTAFLAFLMLVQLYAKLRPPPASPQVAAISLLVAYAVLAVLAAVIDASGRKRLAEA